MQMYAVTFLLMKNVDSPLSNQTVVGGVKTFNARDLKERRETESKEVKVSITFSLM